MIGIFHQVVPARSSLRVGMRLLFALFILFLCAPFTANAQVETDSVPMNDTLPEVVVTKNWAMQRLREAQIGAEKVDVRTMSRLPAMFGERDIIKGLQLLPGVKIEGDGLGGYQVRGGTSAQNNIILDGASVYNAGHLVGLFSTFNDDAIGNAELFRGLMPAQYGGGSSSVLTMSTRTGDTDKHHLSASVGILSAKIEADGPINHSGSSYLAAARISYLNLFIKASGKYSKNSLGFYDINTKFNFRLGDKDLLSLSLFRSHDNIEVEKMMNMAWANTSGVLAWQHQTNPILKAVTQLVASDYSTDQGMDVYSFNVSMKGFNRQLTLRHNQTWTPNNNHLVNAGGESTLSGLQSAAWHIMTNHEREKRDTWFSALWVSDDISLFNDHLRLSAGLRMEWLSALGGKPFYELNDKGEIIDTFYPKKGKIVKTYSILQPRLSLTWRIAELVSIKTGYSRLAQPVQTVRNSSMTLPLDRFSTISNNIKPQIADQIAAGLSMMTNDSGWDFSADAYWKRTQNVYDYREGKTFNTEIEIEQIIIGGRQRAYGLELAAHKNKGKVNGWVAYTLSWAQNQIDGIMDGRWYTAFNDRRHDLVVVLMSQLTTHWRLAATWRYTSGQAMTAPAGKYEISGETFYYFGNRNESHAPDYHRLDLNVSHSKKKGKAVHTCSFGLYNAYNRYNPFFVSFLEDDSKPSGTKTVVTTLFGIIPSVSFSIKY